MLRDLISSLVFVSFLTFGANTQEVKTSAQGRGSFVKEKISNKKIEKSVADKYLEKITEVLYQADSVHREGMWVLEGKRPASGKTPFGKVAAGVQSIWKKKRTEGSASFNCNQYQLQRRVDAVVGWPQSVVINDACGRKKAEVADIQVKKKGEARITFQAEGLSELVGLGASILNRDFYCDLKWDEEFQLQTMNCDKWTYDRPKNLLVKLDKYSYERSGKNILKLKGQVLENLAVIRKIESDVPMQGNIVVTETELVAPKKGAAAAPVVERPQVPPGIVGVEPDAAGKRAANPDQILLERSQKEEEKMRKVVDRFENQQKQYQAQDAAAVAAEAQGQQGTQGEEQDEEESQEAQSTSPLQPMRQGQNPQQPEPEEEQEPQQQPGPANHNLPVLPEAEMLPANPESR